MNIKKNKVCGYITVLLACVVAFAFFFSACDDGSNEQKKTLTGITLDTDAVQKSYQQDEALNLSGLVVTAVYSDSSSETVTGYTTTPANGATLSAAGETIVTVSYTEGSVTRTGSFMVSVSAATSKTLTDITLNTDAVQKSYQQGGTLNLSGLVVTAVYNDSSSGTVTGYTTTPANGAALSTAGETTVTVSYTEGSVTRTGSFTVAVTIASNPSISMAWIPAGTFTMGSPANEPGRYGGETQRQVTLSQGFYMGIYPVTQGQYEAVMGSNPSSGFSYGVGNDYPVYYVNWYDALVFCNRLSVMEGLSPAYSINGSTDTSSWGSVTSGDSTAVTIVAGSTGYRLPTEAQWEYACRAGTTAAFNWGTNTISSAQANFYASDVDAVNLTAGTYLGRTSEVGSYAPNAWGLYDMHGNVWEWCQDWYETYASGAQTDPTGASTTASGSCAPEFRYSGGAVGVQR